MRFVRVAFKTAAVGAGACRPLAARAESLAMLPTTSSLLLAGLSDPANAALWAEFDGRYRPVLFGFARRQGLDDQDAREAAQDTLVGFAMEYRAGRYDSDRGRLRQWLFALARTRIAGIKRRADRDRHQRGESVLEGLACEDRQLAEWEAQWRHALLRTAMQQLRTHSRMDARTLAAFEAVAIEGLPAEVVAREHGLSLDAVYAAKSRALQRLQEIVVDLEVDW
jgi:RNA polymerase sigma factor (sigma-70 family)